MLTASSFALMQETELEVVRTHGVQKEFSRPFSKHSGSSDKQK